MLCHLADPVATCYMTQEYSFTIRVGGIDYECVSEVSGTGPLRQTVYVHGLGSKRDIARYGAPGNRPPEVMLATARMLAKEFIREAGPHARPIPEDSPLMVYAPLKIESHTVAQGNGRVLPSPDELEEMMAELDWDSGSKGRVFAPTLTRLAEGVFRFFSQRSEHSAPPTVELEELEDAIRIAEKSRPRGTELRS
jgi:hypothetical protein